MSVIISDEARPELEETGHPIFSDRPPPPPSTLNNLLVTGVIAVSTLAVLALIAFLYLARSVLIPVMLGIFAAYVLAPLVDLLRRLTRLPHGLAVLFVVLMTLITTGVLGYLIYGEALNLGAQAPALRDKVAALAEQAMMPIRIVEDAAGSLRPAADPAPGGPGATPKGTTEDPLYIRPVQEPVDLLPTILSYVGGAVGLAEDIAIILFVGIFALTGWEMFREKLLTLAGRHRFDVALTVLGGIHTGIQGYLWGMFLIAVVVGVGTTMLLMLFGVPYGILWGMLGGVLAFVPYVGVPLAIIPPLVVGWFAGMSVSALMLLLALYIVFRTIEGQYITVLLLGRHVDMNPLAVLVTLIFWGWLWGPVGLVIGVPLTMVAIVICDQLPGFGFVGELLGGEGHAPAGTIITPGSPAAAEPPAASTEEKPLITTPS